MRERVAQTIQIRKDKRKSNLAQRRQACLGATQQEESSTIRDLVQLARALPGSAKELSFILRNPQVALNFVTQGGFNFLCNYFGDLDVLTCLAYITYSDTCLDVLVKTNKQDLYVLGSKTALLAMSDKLIKEAKEKAQLAQDRPPEAVSDTATPQEQALIEKQMADHLERIKQNVKTNNTPNPTTTA